MEKIEKFASYVVLVNNDGLVFFQAQPHLEFNNPDLVDIDEKENKIVFTKNNNSIVFKEITEEVKQAILKDQGFDVFELDDELNPISNYRYGKPHQYSYSSKQKKVL